VFAVAGAGIQGNQPGSGGGPDAATSFRRALEVDAHAGRTKEGPAGRGGPKDYRQFQPSFVRFSREPQKLTTS
jgi:hypothetical protein